MKKATLLAAAALAMGLAACGGGGDDPPPQENPVLQYVGGWVFTLSGVDDSLACNVEVSMASASAPTGKATGLCRSMGQAVTFAAEGEVDSEGRLTPTSLQQVQLRGTLTPPAGIGTWARGTTSGTWTAKKNAST